MNGPKNIIGTLPEDAYVELIKQTYHEIAFRRMGAVTTDVLDLNEFPNPTRDNVQSANDTPGIILFFTRYTIGEVDDIRNVDILARYFARGLTIHLKRNVLYLGSYDLQRKPMWIGLPKNIEEWIPRGTFPETPKE